MTSLALPVVQPAGLPVGQTRKASLRLPKFKGERGIAWEIPVGDQPAILFPAEATQSEAYFQVLLNSFTRSGPAPTLRGRAGSPAIVLEGAPEETCDGGDTTIHHPFGLTALQGGEEIQSPPMPAVPLPEASESPEAAVELLSCLTPGFIPAVSKQVPSRESSQSRGNETRITAADPRRLPTRSGEDLPPADLSESVQAKALPAAGRLAETWEAPAARDDQGAGSDELRSGGPAAGLLLRDETRPPVKAGQSAPTGGVIPESLRRQESPLNLKGRAGEGIPAEMLVAGHHEIEGGCTLHSPRETVPLKEVNHGKTLLSEMSQREIPAKEMHQGGPSAGLETASEGTPVPETSGARLTEDGTQRISLVRDCSRKANAGHAATERSVTAAFSHAREERGLGWDRPPLSLNEWESTDADRGRTIETRVPLPFSKAQFQDTAGKTGLSEAFEQTFRHQLSNQFADRFLEHAVLARSGGASFLELSLRPAALGKLVVRLEWDGSVLTGTLTAESILARDTMSAHLPLLLETLENHGIAVGSMEVGIGSHLGREPVFRESGSSRSSRLKGLEAPVHVLAAPPLELVRRSRSEPRRLNLLA